MIFEIVCSVLIPLILYFIYTYISHVRSLKAYPPGPFPMPVIGNLYLLSSNPYIQMTELSKIYGDVFSFSFGMVRVVILNSYEPVHEALVTKGQIFAGRSTSMYHIDLFSRGYLNIGFSDYGPVWKMLKKIGHSSLKMYGEGMLKLESACVYESEQCHERLRKANKKPLQVNYALGLNFLNVISVLLFNQRYEEDDPEYKNIIDFNYLIAKGIAGSEGVAFIPWLRYFPNKGLRELRQGLAKRDPFLRKKLLEHRETFDGKHTRDMTDGMLKLSTEHERLKKVGLESLTDDHLEMTIADLLLGGIDTLLTTMEWGILYLLIWPAYQDKLYKEIIDVVGHDRYPDTSDRDSLHLIHASIYEVLRLATLTPLGIPHKSLEKSEIGGKSIPKGSILMFNHWNCHRDENYWENPNEFYPERWLNEDNKFDKGKCVSYFPFSAGYRSCFGQALARLELFTCFSRLIRDFRLENVEGKPLPDMYGSLGLVRIPDHYSCVFVPRN